MKNVVFGTNPEFDKHPNGWKLKLRIEDTMGLFRKTFEGRVLTQVESMFTDETQREAAKSVFRMLTKEQFHQMYWEIVSYIDGYLKAEKIAQEESYNCPVGDGWRDTSYLFKK